MNDRFPTSPLIRFTLLLLYGALTVPLPLLAHQTQAPVSPLVLAIALLLGAVVLGGVLAERVTLTEQGITVDYPRWVLWCWGRGWSLSWSEVAALRMRTTGQGGLVYYLVTPEGDRAYLLPMRVAGFNRLLMRMTAITGLDTQDVRPLAQPWMYFTLLGFSLLLWAIDGWLLLPFLNA